MGCVRVILWGAGLLAFAAAGCGHAPKHQTVKHFDAELSSRLGQAKRADILALMGEPTAQEQLGEIEVWTYFYNDSGNKSRAKPEVQEVDPQHDGLILSFDRDGILQHYHVIIEGRATGRGRSR
jgi:hypothetical protein